MASAMTEQLPPKYGKCFVCSMVLNMLLIMCLFVGHTKWKPSWSMRAAMEAEAVASELCSGHGRAYLDGLLVDGKPVCECNTCFGGPDCSQFSPDCPADVDSGNPLFLEPFWMQNAASGALLVSGWHRMSYSYDDDSNISEELVKHVRKLHSIVGNAITEGRFIVFGTGSTQLLNAAVHSLALTNSSSRAGVVTTKPFYPVNPLLDLRFFLFFNSVTMIAIMVENLIREAKRTQIGYEVSELESISSLTKQYNNMANTQAYKSQTDFFRSLDYNFVGDTSLFKNATDGNANFIEFVTSPNNPDGLLKKAVLEGPHAKAINDHAYFWPHYTAIPAPADEDVMIFTLSKLTGHAGSRFGWALIKDEAVYQAMSAYASQISFGVSHDTQLVALKLLKFVAQGKGEIFDFGFETMRNRWEILGKTLSVSSRFSIQEIEPQYCSFYQKVREPSPAYAWFKCEREEDEDCYAVLRAAGGNWNNYDQLSWSQKAAAEAEAVAAVSCSGHGRAYLDGLFVDGKPSSSSALVVAGWHRMSYVFENNSYISHELEKHIRRLHSIAKNAATSGKYIVFGAGSTQLLNAAVYALSPQNSSSPAKVVASIPYYPIYETQTGFFNSVNFEFEGDASVWKNSTSDSSINVIEFVTAPNNPDGKLNKPTLQGPSVKTIHDLAYFWPHFTAIPAPADEDLMIFTISKLTEIPVRILHISKQLYLRNAAYAWLKCEWEEDKDCSAVLRGANILGRNGSMFAAGNRYVRLSLLRTEDDFEFLLHRMNNLVSDEDGSKTMALAVFVGVYEPTKQKLLKIFPDNLSALAHLTAGAIGGAASSIIRVPTEVVKQRMQTGQFASAADAIAIRCIVVKEGFKGLYAGYGSFLLQDLPFDAIQFCIYEQLRIGHGVPIQPGVPWESHPDYLPWFSTVSHLRVSPRPVEVPYTESAEERNVAALALRVQLCRARTEIENGGLLKLKMEGGLTSCCEGEEAIEVSIDNVGGRGEEEDRQTWLVVGDDSWVGMKMEFEWGREETFWEGGREINEMIFCGCAITGAITTPLDVIKTRLMVQGPANEYKGIVDCVKTIVREEGTPAFFKVRLSPLLAC
ncbi:hypothetical protein RHGRI_031871 [Rhododendron griersonianum]|uniref:Tryptophan aminotransferase-related protein 4 n=1 Tax=Rhododendron griersonianum TaxID=479676 RepID=A0AAV6IBU3_9ERIC|nr:hypothetical protein RHGRI_031871 [Rhododendron griersonianum]